LPENLDFSSIDSAQILKIEKSPKRGRYKNPGEKFFLFEKRKTWFGLKGVDVVCLNVLAGKALFRHVNRLLKWLDRNRNG